MLPIREGSLPVGEFGDKFRNAREKKELSLDDVSNVTKISTRMLQAIEEENFEQLPGGVFNRGFIRAYAKHLGLNSEDAVNDYLACLRQAQIDSNGWDTQKLRDPHEPAAAKPSVLRTVKPLDKPEPPVQVEELPHLELPRIEDVRRPKKEFLRTASSGVSKIWIALAICMLVLALFLWTRHTRRTRTSAPTSSSVPASSVPAALPSTTAAAAPASASTPPSPSPAPPAAAAATPPSPSTSANTSTQSEQPSAKTPPSADRAPVAATPPEPKADSNSVKVEKKGDVTIRSFGATATTRAEKPAAKLTLVVRASENSWISVTSDGQLVTQETLIAPAATSFHATRELVVRVGNAAAISFLWNGEELPSQGTEAEAKTFTFNAEGMHAAPSQQPAPQN
jgi:cytoskeleton protein RodZ